MRTAPQSRMNAPGTNETFQLDECEDLAGLARQLIDGNHAGVLTTVGDDGAPRARWMATFAFNEFPKIRTLTSAASAKVRQIKRHAKVNWMFSNSDLSLIVNLAGTAEILTDSRSVKRALKEVTDTSHAFFLKNFSGSLDIVVIETTVDRIDCTLPQSSLKWSQFVAEPPTKRRPAASRRRSPSKRRTKARLP
ncbi:MAG TPA: pyridoxamine 5'-phosphate oxidase family protein [Terrimicrobiaceae bacterium]|nr:pyridoxamine 5'-phosphate oxidase family protein [Terrimicrobiaceae bacterium]